MSVTRLIATEAPSPNDVPEIAPGVAFAADSLLEAAMSETSPAVETEPVLLIAAVVARFTMSSASEPATPTLPPPAPDFASASKLCFSPAPFTPAPSVTPVPLALPATDASFVTFARVIPTAAPTFAVPPLVADPSAFDVASVFAAELSESAPPALTAVPIAVVAVVELSTIVTATAAATETPPPEVDADGVEVEPDPEPPWAEERALALPRSPLTVSSTPVPGAPADEAPGAPFALAVASLSLDEEPIAWNEIAPAAVTLRCVDASTVWFETVTATTAPTAAVEADAEPDAVVVTEAVWVAVAVSVPPSVAAAPVPSDASVVTVESETATDGTIATPPPAAPVCEVVVIVSVLVACRSGCARSATRRR